MVDVAAGLADLLTVNKQMLEEMRRQSDMTSRFTGGGSTGGAPSSTAGQVTTASLTSVLSSLTNRRGTGAPSAAPGAAGASGAPAGGPPAGQPSSRGNGPSSNGSGGSGRPGTPPAPPTPPVPSPSNPNGPGPGGPLPGPSGGGGGDSGFNLPGLGFLKGAYNQYLNQRAAQDYYRSIEGGTQGNAAMERIREAQYQIQGLGVFSSDEAEQAFKGVTRIGYGDPGAKNSTLTDRQDALDYVYDAKNQRGQTVDESLRQLQIASKSLTLDLKTLGTAMDDVSQSAAKAGVNTQMARAMLTQNLQTGISAGLGNGAIPFAQSVTQTDTSYGRAYASTVDSSGLYGQGMQYRAAALSGMTQHSFRRMARNDPTGYAQALDKVANQGIDTVISSAQKQWIKDRVAKLGKPVDENSAAMIANDFQNDPISDGINDYALVQVLGGLTGRDFTSNPDQAYVFLVMYVGGNTLSAQTAKAQGQMKDTGLKGNGQGGMADSLAGFTKKATNSHWYGDDATSQAAQAYSSSAQSSGKRNPLVEQLLTMDGFKGSDGDEVQVTVQTNKGPQTLSLKDAVTKFPNEIAAGKVVFNGGKYNGQTSAQVLGKADTSRSTTAEQAQDPGGKPVSTSPGSLNTKPTLIGLTPEAQRFFTVVQGNTPTSLGQANGVPPSQFGTSR